MAWLIEYDGEVRVQRGGGGDAVLVRTTGVELGAGDIVTTGPGAFVRILMRNGVEMYAGTNDTHTIRLNEATSAPGGLSGLIAWIFDREPEDVPGWSRSPTKPEPALLITPRDGYLLAEQPVARWMHAIPAVGEYTLRLLRDTSPGACKAGSPPMWTTATSDTTAALPPRRELPAETSYRLELLDARGRLQDYGCFEVPTDQDVRRVADLRASIEETYGSVSDNALAATMYAGLLAREAYFADALDVLNGIPAGTGDHPAARRIKNYVYAEVGPALMIEPEASGE